MKTTILSLVLVSLASPALADVEAGKTALRRGDYQSAYRAFLPDAEAGDDVAMVTIVLLFYRGQLGEVNFTKDWYVRAFDRQNGDALNNIGVMYRDGQGVQKNGQLAYVLFLTVHLAEMGSENTQIRANGNLRRAVSELPTDQIANALCFTDEYVVAMVHGRGNTPTSFKPSASAVRLRDKDWWLPSEREHLPNCR